MVGVATLLSGNLKAAVHLPQTGAKRAVPARRQEPVALSKLWPIRRAVPHPRHPELPLIYSCPIWRAQTVTPLRMKCFDLRRSTVPGVECLLGRSVGAD